MIEDDLRLVGLRVGPAMSVEDVALTLDAADTITALRAEVEALRAALAPFAADWDPDSTWLDGQSHVMYVLVGDVRRAAALLRDKDGE